MSREGPILLAGCVVQLSGLGLMIFTLYKVWFSDLAIVLKLILTPFSIVVVIFAFNTFIAMPIIKLFELLLERRHRAH